MTTVHRAATAVVLGLVAVAVWMHFGPPSQPDRPLPPVGATVAAVAAAYLDAAVRQDCAFTEALTIGRTLAWCTSPTMTAYRNIEEPVLRPKEQAGRDEQCISFEMTNTESSDGSLTDGTRPWSLCFVSTPDGWRLYDQGFL
jgi:hypothetical protein